MTWSSGGAGHRGGGPRASRWLGSRGGHRGGSAVRSGGSRLWSASQHALASVNAPLCSVLAASMVVCSGTRILAGLVRLGLALHLHAVLVMELVLTQLPGRAGGSCAAMVLRSCRRCVGQRSAGRWCCGLYLRCLAAWGVNIGFALVKS
jgi:hypothetical protein